MSDHSKKRISSSRNDDHVHGSPSATITLVEYGDYECPYCANAFYAIQEVEKQMGDRLCFVFRNFPLVELHPQALSAAKAAEAAALQGRFWEMHAMLYENQADLSLKALLTYAQILKLDMPRFVDAMDKKVVHLKIEHDLQTGAQSGVNATPFLFINGNHYAGEHDASSLMQVLETGVLPEESIS